MILLIVFGSVAVVGGILVYFVIAPGVMRVREAVSLARSSNDLKMMGIAMQNYHVANNALPPPAISDRRGKPLLSWRVALLPYVEEEQLFKEFKLDEPWDSEHNKKLIGRIPRVYQPVGKVEKQDGHTYYQVFSSPGTAFDSTKKITLTDIKKSNGTTNTVTVVEAKSSVVWTKPADLKLPEANAKQLPLGGLFEDRWHALFCDCTVRSFRNDMPSATLRAIVMPFGNAVHDFEKYEKK